MAVCVTSFVSEFNACSCPKEALKVVQTAGLSTGELGSLLYQSKDMVNVNLLGDCLGHHADFWKDFANEYPTHFILFAGMDVITAIRTFLWHFRLPGEALQIDRVLSGFARAYFNHNATDNKCEAKRCWEPGARGWYTRQPRTGDANDPCCIHCGALDGQIGDVISCEGCKVVYFCRRCRKLASRQGHAVCGTFGYGRACVAALREAGVMPEDGVISIRRHGTVSREEMQTVKIAPESQKWDRESPFLSQDAIFVLSFAIIMLTTNLHSAKVKRKMLKHEFIQQNREVNAGLNFPGDLLSDIYDNIKQEEVKVMRQNS